MRKTKTICSIFLAIALILGGVMPNAVQASEAQPASTINIEVQYIKNDSDKTVVGQPHKALIPIGFSEKETVELPIVPGFTATSTFPESVEGFTLEENSYTLDYSKFTKDTTIQIIYEPNGVNYTVQHLFQNLEQNNYVINEEMTETKPAKVGDTVTAEAKQVDGFEAVQPMQSEVIPVEEILNLQVRYNRKSYQITYDTDGGAYLDTETKLFGAPLIKPDDPQKKGYTFVKWVDEDGQEFVFDNKTMPAKNLSLKAVWVEGEQTPYRIGYYVQNADGNGYTAVAFVTKQGKTGSPVVLPSEAEQDPVIKYQFPGMNYWDYMIRKWMNNPEYSSWMTEDVAKFNLVKFHFSKAYKYNSERTEEDNQGKLIASDGSTVVPLYFDRQVYTLIIGDDPDYYEPDSTDSIIEIVKDGVTHGKDNPYKIQVRFGEEFTDQLPKPEDVPSLTDSNQFIQDYMIYGAKKDNGERYYTWLGDNPPFILNFDKIDWGLWDGIGAAGDVNNPRVLWLFMRPNTKRHQLRVREYFQDVDGKSYKDEDVKSFNIPLSDEMWCYEAIHEGFTADKAHMTAIKKVKNPIDFVNPQYKATAWYFLIKRDADDPAKPGVYDKLVTLDENGNEVVGEAEKNGYDRNSDGEVDAYFKRNQYELRLHYSYEGAENPVTSQVYFEAPLIKNLPDAASNAKNKPANIPLEYEFQGWYRDPGFADDQKVQDDQKMPAYPLDLYARWEQPTGNKTVTIDPDNGEAPTIKKVPFGNKLDQTTVGTPKKGGYDFVAWRVEGTEDNYDFNRPVTQDFTLKAIWKSKSLATLTIRYINDADESEVKAPTEVPYLEVGTDYSAVAPDIEGLWPDKIIRKFTIKQDDAENVLTFRYRPFTEATYSIRYIRRELQNGQDLETEIKDPDAVTTDRRIDTQNYKPIDGYDPLTLQQTLRLAWDQPNVMTFVYKKAGSDEAGYRIEYYFDKDGSGTYVLDESRSKDYSGKVGTSIVLTEAQMPAELEGCVLNKNISTSVGTITTKPTLIFRIYYDQKKVPDDAGGTGGAGGAFKPGKSFDIKPSRDPSKVIITTQPADQKITTEAPTNTNAQEEAATLPRTGEATGSAATAGGTMLLLAAALLILKRRRA